MIKRLRQDQGEGDSNVVNRVSVKGAAWWLAVVVS